TPQPDLTGIAKIDETMAEARPETVRLWSLGGWRDAPLFERERMPAGTRVAGPAVIAEANATTVVDDGWQAAMTATGHLHLERLRPRAGADVGTAADP